MNSKDKGRKLENYVAGTFKKIDKKARPTRGSGAGIEIGDVIFSEAIIECKKRNTDSITIKRDVWLKLCNSIPMGSIKFPLLILENKYREKWAVLQLEDFARILNSGIQSKRKSS